MTAGGQAEMIEANLDAKAEELLGQMSEANKESTRWFVKVRRNSRIGASTASQYARVALEADQFLKGKPFPQATPSDWLDFHESLKRRSELGEGARHTRLQYLKAILKDRLEVEHLPNRIKDALYMAPPEDPEVGQVIDNDWFYRFLKDAETWFSTRKRWIRPDLIPMVQALLWLLWDSGMRIGETLGLRLGDIDFQAGGDIAVVRMRKDQKGLKTGPRPVPIGECLPALKAWMAIHPMAGDPRAPLFVGFRKGNNRSLAGQQFWRYLEAASERTGWTKEHALGNISAHDFRHTCATRKAILWSGDVILLNRHFGWGPKSQMAFYYAKVSVERQVERVRADLGINTLGYQEGMSDQEQFKIWQKLNAKFLLQQPAEKVKTSMPTQWERP